MLKFTGFRKFSGSKGLLLLLGCAIAGPAAGDVTIFYPVPNGSYPITDPATSGINSAYFSGSFGVSCDGGPHTVTWTVDNALLGEASFYDQITVQFLHKLEGGGHAMEVKTGDECGYGGVKFLIGR